jgi:hypothetical protein
MSRLTISYTSVSLPSFLKFQVTYSLRHILSQCIFIFRYSYTETQRILCILSIVNSFMEPFYHSAVKTIFHPVFFHQIPFGFNHYITQNFRTCYLLFVCHLLPRTFFKFSKTIFSFFSSTFQFIHLQSVLFYSYINSLFLCLSYCGTSKKTWYW